MIIDLTPLNYNQIDKIEINKTLSFSKDDIKNADILDLKNVSVEGQIFKDSLDELNLNLQVTGKMIVPCSRTLKPTDYDFKIQIDENIEKNEEKSKKLQKSIDILPIIWENILMEIPVRIINPDAKEIDIKGDGWELITDSEN